MFREHSEYRIKADKDYAVILNKDLLDDSATVAEIKASIGKATYMFPKQHSCMA